MSAYVNLPASTARAGVSHGLRGTTNFYVSTTGSDSTGTGTQSAPWATPGKAIQAITSGALTTSGNVVVNIAAGNYWQTAITINAADSALGDTTITLYSSDGPGQARLLGGRVLTGWTQYSGNIYRAPLASPVYTLWENGVRARAARTPKLNPGASFPAAFAPYFTAAGVEGSYNTLQYNPVDFNPAAWTLADTRLVVWSVLLGREIDWFTDTAEVSALNTTTKQYSISNGGMKFQAMSTAGARYFVQGNLELLTEAGEFVCTGGQCYYWARDGLVPNQEIVVPTTSNVISIVGTSPTVRASGIVLDGLRIEYSDFNTFYRFGAVNNTLSPPPDDYPYQAQLSLARHGLVYLENTDHITINRCHLKNSGMAGVYIREAGQAIRVSNSLIECIGTTGIYGEGRANGAGDIFKINTYTNNRIRKFGQLVGDGVAMRLNQSHGNVIDRGEFSIGPRQGLVLTGWDVAPNPVTDNYTYANTAKHLYIHDVGQDSGDMGAITLEFFSRAGVQILDQIIIENVTAHSSMLDSAPNGVFTDNQTDGQLMSNIWVKSSQGAFLRINDSGGHTATNCSFNADASVNGSFNSSLIDTANIGVNSDNPYT